MLTIGKIRLQSRLFLGTARYPSPTTLRDAVVRSGAEVITVSLRRESAGQNGRSRFWDYLKDLNVHILPNTAGCHSVREAVTTAKMARDLFGTTWIKLEVIGDDYTLQPDPFCLVEAARQLVHDGFEVFPYMTEDLVVANRLADAGCKILMPWGAPIGSGRGLSNPGGLAALRARFPDLILVVDAGIGRPSHAAAAMELGYDAVLVNTAVSSAADPPAMAHAMRLAVEGGRQAWLAGMMHPRSTAVPSTPILGQAFVPAGYSKETGERA